MFNATAAILNMHVWAYHQRRWLPVGFPNRRSSSLPVRKAATLPFVWIAVFSVKERGIMDNRIVITGMEFVLRSVRVSQKSCKVCAAREVA